MSPRHDLSERARGFTLVETLVALTVSALIIMAAAQAFSFSARESRRAEERLRLALLRDEILFEKRRTLQSWRGEMNGVADDVAWRFSMSALREGVRNPGGRFQLVRIERHVSTGAMSLDGDGYGLAPGAL